MRAERPAAAVSRAGTPNVVEVVDEDKPRKRDGSRACYNKTGAPKAAFATKKLAARAIPSTSVGLAPYACPIHGWHLGHGRR
ncbi:MAG: hypothetical protein ACREM6_13450 [Vulcanimicrobiaceae bacterium]